MVSTNRPRSVFDPRNWTSSSSAVIRWRLALERQQRRAHPIFVRILRRHPTRELLPTAAPDEDTVVRRSVDSPRLVVAPHTVKMREHESTQLAIDAHGRMLRRFVHDSGHRAEPPGPVSLTGRSTQRRPPGGPSAFSSGGVAWREYRRVEQDGQAQK